MKHLKRYLLIISTSFVLTLWIILHINRTEVEFDSLKTKFHYLPNETYCPLAKFDETNIDYIIKVDNCIQEYGDWIIVKDNFAIFNETVIGKLGSIHCIYKSVNWVTDFKSRLSHNWNRFFNNTCLHSDTLLVHCKSQSLLQYYEQYLFGFENINNEKENNKLNDILIVGIDSLSRLAFKRLLKKSYNYIDSQMKESSVIFTKMNVLGDGTTVNVLGILAGIFEMEAYESRKEYPGAKPVDGYPWIWKTLKSKNFTTYYDDDDVEYGTFQYRLLGFESQPTDFYSRPWRMIRDIRKRSTFCMNHRNIFQDQLHNVKTFFQHVRSRKFAFLWSAHFSHNVNEDSILLDEDVLELLREINDPNGLFNNTILILMSDHGHRFNSRLHLQGKYEERLPFFMVHIPDNLKTAFPELLINLKANKNKLVTTMDAYQSILDAVNNFTLKSTSVKHKISLFQPDIPFRQCSDIKIAAHWCSCLQWTEINANQRVIQDAANAVLDAINNITVEYSTKCHRLKLDKVIHAQSIAPSKDMLVFHDSDHHGRVPNMSDKTHVDGVYYRITMQTKPGDAIFESSVHVKNDKFSEQQFSVNVNNIDRNNRYADWIWCINAGMKDVRKYCLCL